MKKSWLLLSVSLCLGGNVFSTEIPAALAQRAIVGEAAGAGYRVQLGVACALRNRAMRMARPLRGVYGVNARHNAGEPAWVWKQCAQAWAESATHDITRGANHFGNAEDVRQGTFKGMTLTVVLGEGRNKTYFFKAL